MNEAKNKLTFESVTPGAGLKAALGMKRADVISTIGNSGLRGRGGAGFPTSVKWNLAAAAKSDQKYVVCNADEGEPGTFKDRLILDLYAGLVFEGMAIAGYAIGATKGIVYLRGEYSYMVEAMTATLAECNFENFDIEIRLGSGAYVCGEETALIESLEGCRGEPRNRPPFPVDTGLMGHPTAVNNVETLAWVASIFSKGADWFKGLGTNKSAGPKLFSVSGDCTEPGVYEFPLGITVAELLKQVGGTCAKAVQIGGASGHCLSADEFGRAIAFEDISTGGSIIVFDPDRDMLDVAENFLEFFVEESCGQCTPCRDGNVKLLEGVKMLKEGTCSTNYLNELCSLAETMQIASKCGLGQSSPNAFLSIIKNFQGEIMGRTEASV